MAEIESGNTQAGAEAGAESARTFVVVLAEGEAPAASYGDAGGSSWDCNYSSVGPSTDGASVDPRVPHSPAEGEYVALYCWENGQLVYSDLLAYQPGNPLGTVAAAERARDQAEALLQPPLPVVELAPPRGADHLVGLPSWYWVTTPWRGVAESVTLAGVTSTVTATPIEVTWDPGDGTGSITCAGPGEPWTDGAGEPACGHTYTQSGSYPLTATIDWEVGWTATTGQGGPLGTLTTTDTVPVTVRQAQAVIN